MSGSAPGPRRRIDQHYPQRKRLSGAASEGLWKRLGSGSEGALSSKRPKASAPPLPPVLSPPSSLGVLGGLSAEVRWAFFATTGPEELGRLALTSRAAAEDVLGWLGSAGGRRRLHGSLLGGWEPQTAPCLCCVGWDVVCQPSQLPRHRPSASFYFPLRAARTGRAWGLLLKASTTTLPTPTRVRLFASLYQDSIRRLPNNARDHRGGFLSLAWGHALQTAVGNWAGHESDQLFDALLQAFSGDLVRRLGGDTKVNRAAVARLIHHRGGHLHTDAQGDVVRDPSELNLHWELRLFLRSLFLDPLMVEDSLPRRSPYISSVRRSKPSKQAAYWLARILGHVKGDQDDVAMGQGKLLFLLYAPLVHKPSHPAPVLASQRLTTVPVRQLGSAEKELGDLAWALESLASYGATVFPTTEATFGSIVARGQNVTSPQLFGLVEELTTFPEPWALDNFAGLLLLAPRLAAVTLALRVVHDSADEAAAILNTAKNLALRWDVGRVYADVLDGLVRKVPTAQGRRVFLLALHAAGSDRLRELCASPHSPTYAQDLTEEIAAQQAFVGPLSTLLQRHLP